MLCFRSSELLEPSPSSSETDSPLSEVMEGAVQLTECAEEIITTNSY
jgi:hypothetical protein